MTVKSAELTPKGDHQNQRRVPRLRVTHELFRLSDNGKIFSIIDLSLKGLSIRILDPEDLLLFSVGRSLSGVLSLEGEKLPILLQVKHIGLDYAGAEFVEGPSSDGETLAVLRQFLDPVEIGKSLQSLPPSEGVTLWCTGHGGTHVLLWKGQDGNPEKLLILMLGFYVSWSASLLQTGTYQTDEIPHHTHGLLEFDSIQLKPDGQNDSEKLAVAKKLIMSSNLAAGFKSFFDRIF